MTIQSTTGAFVIEACAEQYVFILSSFLFFVYFAFLHSGSHKVCIRRNFREIKFYIWLNN